MPVGLVDVENSIPVANGLLGTRFHHCPIHPNGLPHTSQWTTTVKTRNDISWRSGPLAPGANDRVRRSRGVCPRRTRVCCPRPLLLGEERGALRFEDQSASESVVGEGNGDACPSVSGCLADCALTHDRDCSRYAHRGQEHRGSGEDLAKDECAMSREAVDPGVEHARPDGSAGSRR
jgi:hypothetical protein